MRIAVGILAAAIAAVAWGEVARGKGGAAASRSPLATQVGIEVLKEGGNAVDAAVAMGFALAVTHPSAGNVGGGGFMVIRLANGDVVANDHRERAPAKASRDMYLDAEGEVVAGLSTASHLAVGVPGTVAGLLDVLAAHGTLSREAALASAIRLAAEGFALPADIAAQFERMRERFAHYPASLAHFTKADSTSYRAGDVFKQPDLAATLTRIAEQGRDGFYAGRTAELIVAEMERGGGLVSHADLEAYEAAWRAPIRSAYSACPLDAADTPDTPCQDFEIVSMPPPSSGGVLLVQMLNMLQPHDLASLGVGQPATVHLMVEAERRAYADRAEHLGDPDYYEVPVAMLTDPAYANRRFADFSPRLASPSAMIGAGEIWPDESPETTHVSVIDAAGNAVAYTTTLNHGYGAKIVVPGAGFLLNNEMDDFSAKENTANSFGLLGRQANAIEPGKRMLSSMTPTVVLQDGEPFLVTGSPGGSTIITTVLQVVLNVLAHGMSLEDAVAAPRVHHQWQPDRIVYEAGAFSEETKAALEAQGHRELTEVGFRIGDANSVMRLGDELIGVSDPRNAGGAGAF